ncbi:MAG: alpha/beta hydrolase [Clostridia bacterium]
MNCFTFKPNEESDAFVRAFLHTPLTEMKKYRTKRPSVIVCPGGGYRYLSEREAEPVASKYYADGYNVFILYYSLNENAKNLAPLKELSLTIMKIRDNQDEWGCEPEKIASCGFSAGGHLVACISTMWDDSELLKSIDTQNGKNKPNAIIACYAAFSDKNFDKNSSIMNIDGMSKQEAMKFYSAYEKVSKNTCPTFIFHCMNDPVAKVENAILHAQKLDEFDIYSEIHFFPTGAHGGSIYKNETNSKNTSSEQWYELSLKFLNKLFEYEY